MNEHRVAITGRALTTPLGNHVEEVWENWAEQRSSFIEVDSPIKSVSGSRFIGACQNIDRKVLHDRKVQKVINRKDLIGLVAALSAAKDAAINKGDITPERFGMYVGAGSTQIGDLEAYFPLIEDSLSSGTFDGQHFGRELLGSVNPMVMLQTLMNNTLCYTSVALDIRGTNANFMDFQISGLRAIGEAYWAIASGRADVVIAGGVAGRPEPFHAEEGIRMGYLARTDEEGCPPQNAIKPFDRTRGGTILSEGAGFIVLENEEHARRRGAPIYGYVNGMAVASDAGFGFLDKNRSRGLINALRLGLKRCQWEASDIDLIMGHANGSINGDYVEADAYEQVFGYHLNKIPITSPKSVMGEMSEAGAVANLSLGLEALRRKEVLPMGGFQNAEGPCSNLNIVKSKQSFEGNHILITARSFSGLSCVVGISGK